jgi:hypothetical protein
MSPDTTTDLDLVDRLRGDADRLRSMHFPTIAGTLDDAAAALEDTEVRRSGNGTGQRCLDVFAAIPADQWDDSDYDD